MRVARIVASLVVLLHGSDAWTSVRGGGGSSTTIPVVRSLDENTFFEIDGAEKIPTVRDLKEGDRILKSSKKSSSSSSSKSSKSGRRRPNSGDGEPPSIFSEDLLDEFEEAMDEAIMYEFSYPSTSKSGKKSSYKSTKSSSSSGDYTLYGPDGHKRSKKSKSEASSYYSGSKKSKSGDRLTLPPAFSGKQGYCEA